MSYVSENMELGAHPPVDQFPFRWMRLIPARFAFWKARAIRHGKEMDKIIENLWDEYLVRRRKGDVRDCLLDKLIDDEAVRVSNGVFKEWKYGLHSLQFLGGEILEGGADTTSSTLISFFLAMACNLEVQKKAQQQLDAVCGSERTPHWSDYDKLPYIAQIQKETMRWRPVTVLGFPHVAREDDIFKGFKIPKGAGTVTNTW